MLTIIKEVEYYCHNLKILELVKIINQVHLLHLKKVSFQILHL
jgi:hypothetical protein